MSREIDERIVEMRFDNEHFEKNVQTSMSTLDKFKQKLQFKNASKGFDDIDKAAKNTDLSPLAKSAEQVSLKFNALYTIADQAFRNITNSAMATGKRIIDAFAIDPIKTGLQEYETQINSVQTILANTESKGSTLQDVNSALAQLNEYADKTIYNFTEMTRNIGTFTAAGVDLKTSVSAIKGIANLAAVSGSTSQQASTAMYQLSQALSSGTVKLMDWNSVVNAGMGGQVFQDSLKETARVHGIAIDKMIEENGSFRETLQEGWLTAEILTETLSKFTGDLSEEQLKSMGYTEEQIKGIMKLGNTANDAATKVKTFTQLFDTLKEAAQSGWTKSWELLIGDFGEAKELLTEISDFAGDIIGKSADKRNEMLMGGLSTGWKQLLNEGIHDAAGFEEAIANVAKQHGVDLNSMVDDETTFQEALKKTLQDGSLTHDVLGESISSFTEKVSGMSAKEIEAAGYTAEQVEKLKELDESVKNGSISMEKFSELMIRPSGRELLIESLWNSVKALSSVITPVTQAFEEFFPALNGEQLYGVIEAIRDFTSKLTLSETQSENLKRTFRGVFAVLDMGVQILKAVCGGFVDMVKYIAPAGNGLLSFTASIGDFLVKVNKASKTSNIFAKIISGIGSVIKPIADAIKTFATSACESFTTISITAEKRLGPLTILGNIIKSIFEGLGSVLGKLAPMAGKLAGGIGGAFSNIMSEIADAIQNADYNKIFDILNGGIFSAIGIFIAKFVKSTGDVVDNAADMFEGFSDILEGVGDTIESFALSIKVEALKKIASALLMLAAALFVISLIDSEKLTSSLAAITALFGELIGTLQIFTKISDGKQFNNIGKVTRAMGTLSTALLVLAVAMKIMGSMSWQEIGVGIVGTVVGITALVTAVNFLPEGKVHKAAKAVKTLATSLVVLAVAMKIMGSMSWQEMGVGLITTAVGMGILVGAVNLLPKNTKSRVAGILGLTVSLVVLSAALKIMASMDIKEIGVALLGMGVGLALIVATVNLLPKDTAIKTLGLLGLATSLVVLGAALKIMGSMGWDEIGRGLTVLAGSLALIVIAMALMKTALPGAAALLIVAASLAILTPVLLGLGSMSWGEIAKGLAAIAGAFAIIGVAALVLGPIVPVILGLSAAIALFGVGCVAVGAGVMLFAVGITALAAALAASGGAIVVFVSSIIGLIPFILEQIGIGIIAFCEAIAGGADSICKAITVIILAAVEALVTSVPAIVEGVFVLIDSLLSTLIQYTPVVVDALFDFIIGILTKIAERMPDLIQAGVNLIMSFFIGVVEALKSIDVSVLMKGIAGVGLLTALIAALAAVAVLTPLAMIGVLGMAAIVAELSIVLAAIGAISQIPGLEWLISEGGDFLQTLGTAIGKFLGGIVGGFAEGMSAALPKIATDLSIFMTNLAPFIDGAKMIDEQALSGVKSLVEIMLLITGANILESLTSWLTGGSSIDKFGAQLSSLGTHLRQFATNLGTFSEDEVTSIKCASEAIKAIAGAAAELPNEGGWLSAIVGDNSIDAFGSKLPALGTYIKEFATNVNGISADSVEGAVGVITSISDLASNDLGDAASNIDKFGKKINTFVDKLDDFVSEMKSISSDAIETSIAKLRDFVSIANELGGANIDAVKSFGEALKALAEDGIKKFVAVFTSSDTKTNIEEVINELLNTSVNDVKTEDNFAKFKMAGKYLVDGFAAGISENTYIAAAKAKAMAKAAEDAANKELQVNSPSKKFISIGGYVVEGFSNGITSNLGEVKNAANMLGSTMLDATQRNLKINSPSLVFNKEVGQYIVQGIAEGIDKNTSAEDAAKKKAQNIITAFQNEIDKYDVNSEIAKKEFELWKLGDGKKASTSELDDKQLEFMNSELSRKLSTQQLRHDEWKEMSKYFGANSKEERDAWSKYLDAQKDVISIQTQIADLDSNSGLSQIDHDMRMLDLNYENWKINYPDAKESVKRSKLFEKLDSELKLLKDAEEINRQRLNDIAEKYNSDSPEYLAAYEAWVMAKADRYAKEEEISDTHEYNLEAAEEASDRLRDSAYELWKSENEDASDREKLTKDLAHIEESILDANEDVLKAQEEYNKALEEEDADQTKINNKLADLNEKKKIAADLQNQKNDTEERMLSLVEEERSIASDIAKLKYDIWEKNEGRNATDAEKEMKKLETLNQQLLIQNQITNEAMKEYNKVKEEHGPESIEATRAYQSYLNEVYNLSQLKNDILDLEESAADRQKRLKDKQDLASQEYDDYIKQYEKYYTANGMSRADLERDAKLVSGYDPTNVVNNITSKTQTALESVTTSVNYQSILTGFSDMGTSYVQAMGEGATTQMEDFTKKTFDMVVECSKKLTTARTLWNYAGKQLVNGLIQGVNERKSAAIEAAVQVAISMYVEASKALDINSPSRKFAEIGKYSILGLVQGLVDNSGLSDNAATRVGESAIENLKASISKISDVVNSDLDTQPTIRPVLDLSNIRSGTARLNAMMSATQAMSISDSRKAREYSDGNQNGNDSSTNTGNTYQFTQNNYSPKALPRSEIYRQTKNQFAAMKEVLG